MSYKTGLSPVARENRLCKILRNAHGIDNIEDVFFEGDILYKLRGKRVVACDYRGKMSRVHYSPSVFGAHYKPGVCWWSSELVLGKGLHEWEEEVVALSRAARGDTERVTKKRRVTRG